MAADAVLLVGLFARLEILGGKLLAPKWFGRPSSVSSVMFKTSESILMPDLCPSAGFLFFILFIHLTER